MKDCIWVDARGAATVTQEENEWFDLTLLMSEMSLPSFGM